MSPLMLFLDMVAAVLGIGLPLGALGLLGLYLLGLMKDAHAKDAQGKPK